MIEIYTDGAYNPVLDQGGWAAVLIEDSQKRFFSGTVKKTTNNRMEISAALEGISHTPIDAEVVVYTDSQYLFGSMTKHWKRGANQDLWAKLDEATNSHKVRWEWIRGDDQTPLHKEAHQRANKEASLQANDFVSDAETTRPISAAKGKWYPNVTMVDVGEKAVTRREAIARGIVRMKPATIELILKGSLVKGDVLGVAQVAGIMAAKQTPYLIPLCHSLLTEVIEVQVVPQPAHSYVEISARVRGEAKTGMEMEALTAVAGAALTVYDMCKGVDPGMTIEINLVKKSGGRSGTVIIEHSGGNTR